MRDLRAQNFGARRAFPKKLIRFSIIVLFIVGIFYFVISRFNLGSAGSSVSLREAPRGLTPVSIDDQSNITAGAVDLTTQTINLENITDGKVAKATATRSFGGGLYILTVEATLPDPVNVPYQVWLVGGGSVIPIDYMSGSKTSWSLNLRSPDKYSRYDGIWITLERTKDELPEEHVMEGSF